MTKALSELQLMTIRKGIISRNTQRKQKALKDLLSLEDNTRKRFKLGVEGIIGRTTDRETWRLAMEALWSISEEGWVAAQRNHPWGDMKMSRPIRVTVDIDGDVQ